MNSSLADQSAITIDPEFKILIANPSPEEFSQLELNILRDGCQEPLSLWASGDRHILIDGHNRHAICQKHNLPFQTAVVNNLPDRDAVILWIEERQLGRRNLTDDQRSVIADSIRERRAAVARRDRAIKGRAAGGDATPEQEQSRQNRSENTLSPKRLEKQERTRAAVAREAKVPERKLRTVMEIREKAPELVSKVRAGSLSLAEAKRQIRKAELDKALNSIEAIEAKKLADVYDVVVIDPPWPMEKIERDVSPNQVKFDYPTLSIEEISSEVDEKLLSHLSTDAHVFLWTTHRFLPDALNLLKGWGLKYVCAMVWHKPGGFQPFGLPQYNCEFVLYARKGSPKFIDTKQFFTCFDAPRGKHSEKPQAFYDLLCRVTGGRRLDMFNRREINGFDGWGKEAA